MPTLNPKRPSRAIHQNPDNAMSPFDPQLQAPAPAQADQAALAAAQAAQAAHAANGWRALMQRVSGQLPDIAAFAFALVTASLAAVLLASLPGCGGGVGSEGTGSYASGTISGYGSIIVNGVHFTETTAVVKDDDDQVFDSASLGLGMVVQITGGPISTAADGSSQAVASTIRTQRALVGPVSAVNAGTGQITVLGQTVTVSSATWFDGRIAGGLAAITTGQWLAIYGFYNSGTTSFNATRIALSGPSAGPRVSGPVGAIDAQAKTFKLGSQTYSFAALGSTPAANSQVTLKLQSAAHDDAGGNWVVSGEKTTESPPQDRDGAEVDGVVSTVLSVSRFVVNGVTVDSSAARVSGTVLAGARVEASGTLRAGVLVANQIQASATTASKTFELNGTLSSLDIVNRRFVLRATTVSYAGAVFNNFNAAKLVGYTGKLKVKGMVSGDGTLLAASSIQFSD